MIHEIKITPDVAHFLEKLSKKERFYFCSLTRTDHTDYVFAFIGDRGLASLERKNINIIDGNLTNLRRQKMVSKIITRENISAVMIQADSLHKLLNNDGLLTSLLSDYIYPNHDGDADADAYADVMQLRHQLHSLQQACVIVIRQLTLALHD